jgi:hypothetical protein
MRMLELKGDDDQIAQYILDHLALLTRTKHDNTSEAASQRWLRLRAFYADPRFEALARRFPRRLATLVHAGGNNPLFDGAIPHLLASPEPWSTTHSPDVQVVKRRFQSTINGPAFDAPLLISGFYHSGTTLLTRIMEAVGIFLPSDTRGHEWRYTKALNALLLFDRFDEQKIQSFRPEQAVPVLDRRAIAFRLAQVGYSGDVPWGTKDPRSSITANAWIAAFPHLRILNIIRSPLDVIGTLPSRPYSGRTPENARPQAAAEVWGKRWRIWIERVRQSMRQTQRSCEVRFEDVCASPAGAALYILEKLGLDGFDATRALSIEIDSSRIGIYRSWIERGDLAESEIDILKPLALEYGFSAD